MLAGLVLFYNVITGARMVLEMGTRMVYTEWTVEEHCSLMETETEFLTPVVLLLLL